MKRRTIKAILSKKFNEFVESIKDEKVKKLVRKNSVITGGAIVSLLLNEKVKDFDVYFKNKETVKAVAEYYCNVFNEKNKTENMLSKKINAWVLDGEDVELWKRGKKKIYDIHPNWEKGDVEYNTNNDENIKYPIMFSNTASDRIKIIIDSDGLAEEARGELSVEELIESADGLNGDLLDTLDEESEENTTKEKYRPLYLTTNAITLSHKMQLIIRFYGSVEEIHKNYDFVHATCCWDSETNNLTLPARALEAIINKELFYMGSKYPLASVIRTRKFIRRGWQINAGQYLKMLFQISELDLSDMNVLEEQLVGVDSHYFNAVIKKLKEKQLNDKKFSIDSTYLVSVIDRIF